MLLTASLIQVWAEPPTRLSRHTRHDRRKRPDQGNRIARHQPLCGVRPFRIDKVAHAAERLARSAVARLAEQSLAPASGQGAR